MIIRYTSPYHNFILPFLSKDIDKVTITYSQNGVELIKKNKEDITITDISTFLENASMGDEDYIDLLIKKINGKRDKSLVTIHLTQEETALFNYFNAEEKNIAKIQFHIVSNEGNSFVSRLVRMRVYNSITEEVL